MSARPIPLKDMPVGDVEAAWEAYAALNAELIADPGLQHDPGHKARRESAHAEFMRLFAPEFTQDNVIPFRRRR